MLGSKEPKPYWHRQEELYNSWDAEVHLHKGRRSCTTVGMQKYICITLSRDCHAIIETFVFRQESVCTESDVLGSRNVLPEFR